MQPERYQHVAKPVTVDIAHGNDSFCQIATGLDADKMRECPGRDSVARTGKEERFAASAPTFGRDRYHVGTAVSVNVADAKYKKRFASSFGWANDFSEALMMQNSRGAGRIDDES